MAAASLTAPCLPVLCPPTPALFSCHTSLLCPCLRLSLPLSTLPLSFAPACALSGAAAGDKLVMAGLPAAGVQYAVGDDSDDPDAADASTAAAPDMGQVRVGGSSGGWVFLVWHLVL